MKRKLTELMQGIPYICLKGTVDVDVAGLVYDSRQAHEGCVFFCISGFTIDGHTFAEEAQKKGAAALIVEKEALTEEALSKNVTVVKVENARRALALMSAAWFGHPARELITIGITGTKGKTTTAYMVQSILKEAGILTGLIGTIEIKIGEEAVPTENTTPESYVIQQKLREMVNRGCRCVVMEVSSQGLLLCRTEGFTFDYGIFTNLEPDHIGPKEHKSFQEYLECKAMLFRRCRQGILNADDPHLKEILKSHTCRVATFGIQGKGAWQGSHISYEKEQGKLSVSFVAEHRISMDNAQGVKERFSVTVGIPGGFHVLNALAAMAVCVQISLENPAFTVNKEHIQSALAKIRVRGRMEPVQVPGAYAVFIDYAHNAMSLEGMLRTVRAYRPKRLICMFGCGGNRSKIRRYQMGETSAKLADLTVITTDNPRFEEPWAIMEDIQMGVAKAKGGCVMIEDRKAAVRYCLKEAKAGDVIVLAGKGHESYQEIRGVKYPMDERKLVEEALLELSRES